MGSRWVIGIGYGRCLEGYQRTQEQIDARLRALRYCAASADEVADDLELLCLLVDRAAWVQLLAETPKFVGVGHG